MYTNCTLYCSLTADYVDMELVTSDWMLLLIFAASGITYHFEMSILGHIFGGCNCCVAVDQVVSALLLYVRRWRRQVGCSACCSARFGSNRTALRCLWRHDLLLCKGEEDDDKKKWEVLRNI